MPLPKTIIELRQKLENTRLELTRKEHNLSVSYQEAKKSTNFHQPVFNLELTEHNELLTAFKRIPIEISACTTAVFQITQHDANLAQRMPDAECSSLPETYQSELEDILRISEKILATMDQGVAAIRKIEQLVQTPDTQTTFQSLLELLSIEESWDKDFDISNSRLQQKTNADLDSDEEKDKLFFKLHSYTTDSASELAWSSDDDIFSEEDLDLIENKTPQVINQFNQMALSDTPKPTVDSTKTAEAFRYSYS